MTFVLYLLAAGDCTCRSGISGKQCSTVMEGFFFPNFTHVKTEVEMASQDVQEYFWMLKGYKSTYLGKDFLIEQHEAITYGSNSYPEDSI